MTDNSDVIKNAKDSDSFSCDYEIEPEALKSILSHLHTPKYAHHEIDMYEEKYIQHILLICKWLQFTNLYTSIIEHYKSLLQTRKSSRKIFRTIDDKLYEFLDLKEPKISILMHICKVYNPIYSLITGDKLNDADLIDVSLSLFNLKASQINTLNRHKELCDFLKEHCINDTTREKIDTMFNYHNELHEKINWDTALDNSHAKYIISSKFDWNDFSLRC